jgi:hypothetical protein
MTAANDPAPCPGGHEDTVKLLTTVAVGGLRSRSAEPARVGGGGGGCCGGGCCG